MKNRIRSRGLLVAALALIVGLGVAVAFAENIDPFDTGDQYAWGENVGWLNAEPANCSDCGVEVSDTALTGYIWGENIGWINLSCTNPPDTCGTVSYGVTNDGAGNLAGYAWGENVGWISLSCSNTGYCGTVNYGVTIDGTGEFIGYAWGENIGWISFSDDAPVDYGVVTSWCAEDSDGDGVCDAVDTCPSGPDPPWAVPPGDTDCDGWDTADENLIGTDPNVACAGDNWPPDIAPVVRDDFVDISDINMLRPPVFFSTAAGGPPYDTRLDIARDAGDIIDISDINKLRPPIFFAACTP